MKHATHTSIPTQESLGNIYGLPDRMVYYIGVFTFYVLIFFAISYFTQKDQVRENEEIKSTGLRNTR